MTLDPRVSRLNRLLDRHTLERLEREDHTARRLFQVLERSREEMFARLLAFEDRWGTTSAYTQGYLGAVLEQLNGVIATMRTESRGILHASLLEGYHAGQEQTYREVAVFYGADYGPLQPKIPTAVMAAVLEGRTAIMAAHFARVEATMRLRLEQAAHGAIAHADAVRHAGRATEAVQEAIARGIAQGQGTAGIARRLMAPDGEFPRMTYREALTTTRLAINDAYNEGHATTLLDARQSVPRLRQTWMSALVRSTEICLCLHGQRRELGEEFSALGWAGPRPPAIGAGARPRFHLCRSRVVPDHPDWPSNPKLAPLTPDERDHFLAGGGFRAQDRAGGKHYRGFTPPPGDAGRTRR